MRFARRRETAIASLFLRDHYGDAATNSVDRRETTNRSVPNSIGVVSQKLPSWLHGHSGCGRVLAIQGDKGRCRTATRSADMVLAFLERHPVAGSPKQPPPNAPAMVLVVDGRCARGRYTLRRRTGTLAGCRSVRLTRPGAQRRAYRQIALAPPLGPEVSLVRLAASAECGRTRL